ncbi:probable methyltransferase PMT5 [Tanacetum coccineum]
MLPISICLRNNRFTGDLEDALSGGKEGKLHLRALLERVFMPCDMYFRYTRHKGGTTYFKEQRDMQLLNMSKRGVLLPRQIKLGSTGDDLRFKTVLEECFNELKEHVIPSVLGNFNSRKLPSPSLSYDMVHCAECGILWDDKGDENQLPPYNMIRNVMDMNAHYGGLNTAFLEEGKAVWVMNVVPIRARNTLLVILNQGFAGVLHDWCEPFPTYPRTYDMLHANGLLSYLMSKQCSITNLLLEMDRVETVEGGEYVSFKKI